VRRRSVGRLGNVAGSGQIPSPLSVQMLTDGGESSGGGRSPTDGASSTAPLQIGYRFNQLDRSVGRPADLAGQRHGGELGVHAKLAVNGFDVAADRLDGHGVIVGDLMGRVPLDQPFE